MFGYYAISCLIDADGAKLAFIFACTTFDADGRVDDMCHFLVAGDGINRAYT